jgi:outer membrane protein assembly factor BamC
MNKPKKCLIAVAALVFLNLPACGWLKSQLPDKEKDYYYSAEIPPLIIPEDLESSAIAQDNQTNTVGTYGGASAGGIGADKVMVPTEIEQVKLISFDGGATRLQIKESLNRGWRIVGKALTRQSVEIIDRNIDEGVYYVQYDPNARQYEDGSIWDEFVFFFGGDQSQEKEYRVRMTAKESQLTEVIITDEEDNPLSEGPGLSLLTSLYETIKADYLDN